MKTDIEEYDYFALLGLGRYLADCKFIQFELGVGAPLKERQVTNYDYFSLLDPYYNLFLVRDENNPIWKKGASAADLVSIKIDDLSSIEKIQQTGIGFNVFGVNRDFKKNLDDLEITQYNGASFEAAIASALNLQSL